MKIKYNYSEIIHHVLRYWKWFAEINDSTPLLSTPHKADNVRGVVKGTNRKQRLESNKSWPNWGRIESRDGNQTTGIEIGWRGKCLLTGSKFLLPNIKCLLIDKVGVRDLLLEGFGNFFTTKLISERKINVFNYI